MFGLEPYILFSLAGIILIGLAISYYAFEYFEIAIVAFLISSLIAAAFYDNAPVWITEELESGLGSYLRGGMLLFSGSIGLVHFLKRTPLHNFKLPVHLIVLFLFVVLSLASTLYSIDRNSTFIRASLLTSVFLFLLGLNSWLDSETKFNRLLNTVFYIIAVVLFVNLISMFLIPSRSWWWKTPSRFLGLFSHPNALGGFCAVSFPIILWKINNLRNNFRFLAVILLVMNLFILVSTGSRTSIIMISIITLLWLLYKKDWIKLGFFILLAIIGSLFINQIGVSSLERNEGSELTDLTEREFIWKGASAFIKERPILGYGYAVEGKIFADQLLYDMEEQFFNANAQQPLHNGYLSIFIGGGTLGLLLWLSSIGLSLYFLLKSKYSLYKIYAAATIIALLVANMVETAVTGYLSPTDLFFWIAWIIGGKLWILAEKNSENTNLNHPDTLIESYAK